MPRPRAKSKAVKVTEVKTVSPTYTAVRLSIAVLVFTAMIGSSVILAALIIRVVPIKDSDRTVTSTNITRSADGAVSGELLVKFKSGSTQLERTQAVNKSLEKPVRVTTLTTINKRVGFRNVTQMVESESQKIATLKSITPVIQPTVKLTSTGFNTRAKRGAPTAVVASAAELAQWYIVKIEPSTASLSQISSALRKQTGVLKVETNRRVNVAAVRSLSTTTAGATIKLADAQKSVGVQAGDANADGTVDGKDLRLLINYLLQTGAQPTNTTYLDINRDGHIDSSDLTALVDTLKSLFTITPADLTNDGKFDADDMNLVARYLTAKGAAPNPLSKADLNLDGIVDISDLSYMVAYIYGDVTNPALHYGNGDANADGIVDKRDLDYLVAYLTGKGPAPEVPGLVDMDLDGVVDLTDLSYLVDLLYDNEGDVQASLVVGSTSSSSSSVSTVADEGSQVVPRPTYILGDSNGDSKVTPSDIHFLVQYLIGNGPAPSPLARVDFDSDGVVDLYDLMVLVDKVYVALDAKLAAADFNGDSKVDKADVTYLVKYLTAAGPAPDLVKADIIEDGVVDIGDLTAMIQYVYMREEPIQCEAVRTVNNLTFLNGDVNGSGTVTKSDITKLGDYLYKKATAPAPIDRGDVDCNGVVDTLDLVALKKVYDSTLVLQNNLPVITGDANNDGFITSADISAAVKIYGQSTLGDVNRDGATDFKDSYDLTRILGLNVAKRALPDLSGDGKVDWADADVIMNATMGRGGEVSSNADINSDGVVDVADGIAFVEKLRDDKPVVSVLAGDANTDAIVDCQDVRLMDEVIFRKATTPKPLARLDVNGDGAFTYVDTLLLAQRACPVTGGGSLASDVRVAILDSGVKAVAAEIKPILISPAETLANGIDDDRNGYIDDKVGYTTYTSGLPTIDCNGHGTALASIVAGKTGVASYAKIIPIKVVDCKGSGTALALSQGLVYATVRGADISIAPVSGVGTSSLFADVVAYAKSLGMLVIGAAGNDGAAITRVFPANTSGVISIGATIANGRTLASYSNIGAHVVAPGSASGVKYEGTSVSTAYVAGTAALLIGKTPNLTLKQIEAKLLPKPKPTDPKALKLLDAASVLTK